VIPSKEPGNGGDPRTQLPPRPLEFVKCFKCGSMGHYADRCSNKPSGGGGGRPPSGGGGGGGMPIATSY
jgi:hypothetical protein